MRHFLLLTTLLFALAACHSGNKRYFQASSLMTPIKAIELSAQSAPKAVDGIFELTVKSTECHHRLEFLNSEIDNKDQRNLIIALRPQAVQELINLYGVKPADYFVGKTIRVEGEAKRVKQYIMYDGKNTRDYYYQTKVFVKSAQQLTII